MKYLAIDLETTGLKPWVHATCQIGMVLFEPWHGLPNVRATLKSDIFVDTNKYAVDDRAPAVNGFTLERLRAGTSGYVVACTIGKWLEHYDCDKDNTVVVFQNAPFDMGFINFLYDELKKSNDDIGRSFHDLTTLFRNFLDTRVMGYFVGEERKHRSLKELVELLAPHWAPHWNPHDALGDAEATAIVCSQILHMQERARECALQVLTGAMPDINAIVEGPMPVDYGHIKVIMDSELHTS